MIEDIVFKLADLFSQYDWDVDYDEPIGKYCILVNDFDFYMKDKSFRKWITILRKKYPKVGFYCCYKNFKH